MKTIKYLAIFFTLLLFSCNKFLEIDPPKSSLIQASVFQSEETAVSAMLGIYSGMAGSSYAGGGNTSITMLAGLSADEFDNYSATFKEFADNQLSNSNSTLRSLYLVPYQHILAANAMLEGLASSELISPPVKKQLEGEARFVRAFVYFYLVNLFGDIPLQLSTDYRQTRNTPLSSTDQVYTQVIQDLKIAETLLSDQYPSTERVRPNLSAVQALLSRAYLYKKDWLNAEKYAGMVIAKTGSYSLPTVDAAFLKDSPEAIWQLFPTAGANTREGNLFILTATPINVALKSDFATNGFETGDKRRTGWIKNYSNTTGSWFYPNKYKVKSSTTITEYSIVLRLAEQYLIRAEALAEQNKLDAAISDLDKIRSRAGLPLIKTTKPQISQSELLQAILNERKVELFSEWGHRWLDLKRSRQAGNVLRPIKPDWQESDQYYPLPADEINRNPNIH